jgi:TRAP-type C4-dicarboxylate transport system permease small subunit
MAAEPRERRALGAALALLGDHLPAILLSIVVAVVTADVVGRYFFRAPLRGANEVALIGLIWLVFLGIVGVSRHDQHIGVEFFVSRLPRRARGAALLLRNLVIALIAAGAAYAALMQVLTGRFATLPLTGLHKTWLTIAALIGLVIVAAIHLARAARRG